MGEGLGIGAENVLRAADGLRSLDTGGLFTLAHGHAR
jgi:hypothetical protein